MRPSAPDVDKTDDLLVGTGLVPGSRVGAYELIAPVGRGGMAAVWAARRADAPGSQLLAVKTMLPALSADPRFERMFLAEAGLASALQHPNICRVVERGDDAGVLYLVMEWVRGASLASLLEDTRVGLPAPVAGRIALDVARGLAAAHDAVGEDGAPLGIVHRDVSPHNILVAADGSSRITDFGIAKIDGGPATQAGYVKGKVRYMSPEQVYCEEVNRRTDVFALGVVLYEATTGVHPFAGPTDVATLAKIAAPNEAPRPSSIVDGYPEALERLVTRAVAKEPEARFATMHELADELEALFGDAGATQHVGRFVRDACAARMAALDASIESYAKARSMARGQRARRVPIIAAASLVAVGAVVAIAAVARSSAAPSAAAAADVALAPENASAPAATDVNAEARAPAGAEPAQPAAVPHSEAVQASSAGAKASAGARRAPAKAPDAASRPAAAPAATAAPTMGVLETRE